ncbi:hypothetical protein K1719_025831 [Acacia pycnantha]|nr:hypothetical protein K1719_025831 [Acacia pycnantha]
MAAVEHVNGIGAQAGGNDMMRQRDGRELRIDGDALLQIFGNKFPSIDDSSLPTTVASVSPKQRRHCCSSVLLLRCFVRPCLLGLWSRSKKEKSKMVKGLRREVAPSLYITYQKGSLNLPMLEPIIEETSYDQSFVDRVYSQRALCVIPVLFSFLCYILLYRQVIYV